MDFLLCLFRCAGIAAFFRLDVVLWYGLCWHAWYGVGMADRNGIHSVCCDGHG